MIITIFAGVVGQLMRTTGCAFLVSVTLNLQLGFDAALEYHLVNFGQHERTVIRSDGFHAAGHQLLDLTINGVDEVLLLLLVHLLPDVRQGLAGVDHHAHQVGVHGVGGCAEYGFIKIDHGCRVHEIIPVC
jgi:hypothetical protein